MEVLSRIQQHVDDLSQHQSSNLPQHQDSNLEQWVGRLDQEVMFFVIAVFRAQDVG